MLMILLLRPAATPLAIGCCTKRKTPSRWRPDGDVMSRSEAEAPADRIRTDVRAGTCALFRPVRLCPATGAWGMAGVSPTAIAAGTARNRRRNPPHRRGPGGSD